jgi:hypothetical protein
MPGVRHLPIATMRIPNLNQPLGVVLAVALLLTLPAAARQVASPAAPDKLEPTNCEINATILQQVPQERFQGEGQGDVVMAIARLGDREYSRGLNQRRLFNVRRYLENARGLNPKRIVIAKGERVGGYGRVEIYVDGTLLDVLVAKRGKDVYVSCSSGAEDEYYPGRSRRGRYR